MSDMPAEHMPVFARPFIRINSVTVVPDSVSMLAYVRPFWFRSVAVTVAVLIGGGMLGVSIACAAPTSESGAVHTTTSGIACCADEVSDTIECAGPSACQFERHGMVPPSSAVLPPTWRIQPDPDELSLSALGVMDGRESAMARQGSQSVLVSSALGHVLAPVSLHLLYSVFLN